LTSLNNFNIIRIEKFYKESIYDKVKRGDLGFVESTSFYAEIYFFFFFFFFFSI